MDDVDATVTKFNKASNITPDEYADIARYFKANPSAVDKAGSALINALFRVVDGTTTTYDRNTLKDGRHALTAALAKWNDISRVASEIDGHHPWNAQIHHTIQPVSGTYPTYYATGHLKEDMSARAHYPADVRATYDAYHMFAGAPLASARGGVPLKAYRYEFDGAPITEMEPAQMEMPPLLHVGCHGNYTDDAASKKKKSKRRSKRRGPSPVRAPAHAGLPGLSSDEEDNTIDSSATLGVSGMSFSALPGLEDVFE